jgi:dipeptidyl aminopeptidase/acylaminoacyl peptidase
MMLRKSFCLFLAALFLFAALAASAIADGMAGGAAHKKTPPVKTKRAKPAAGALISKLLEEKNAKFNQYSIVYGSGGLKVTGKLIVPEGAGKGTKKYPAVVFNHGGVDGIPGPLVTRSRQLAEAGYVVLAPSYRGEGGSEGEVEVAAGEVDDALNAVVVLRGLRYVDTKRIAMVGASHGGIITLLAVERDRSLAAAVCAYGVTNTFTWYKYLVDNGFDVSDPLSIKVYGKGPEDKPAAFRRRAPALDAALIKTPLLLLYGEKDTTVPPSQGNELAAALDADNISYSFHVIPEVGHGFLFFMDPARRSETEIRHSSEAWNFLLEFLAAHTR